MSTLPEGKLRSQSGFFSSNNLIIALIVVVLLAYISIFADANRDGITFTPLAIAVMFLAGGVSLFLMLREEELTARFPGAVGKLIFFGVQFLMIAIVGYFAEARGQWWLLSMPVVGSAAEYSRGWWFGIGLGSMVLVCSIFAWEIGNWSPFWLVPPFMAPAVVFVIIFSRYAVLERNSRQQVEELAHELRGANQKLSEYASKVEELAIIRERNRMAREIHDSLGHYLTVVNVQIGGALAVLEKDPEKAKDVLGKAQRMTQEGLADVRQSVAMLRESPEERPLTDTLPELVDQANAAGITTTLHVQGTPRPLGSQATRTIYRSVQEGLTNVRKYARASTADVRLDYRQPDQLQLIIQDNGIGTQDTEGGFGLVGMRERVHLLKGTMAIKTAVGEGLTLTITIPTPPESTPEGINDDTRSLG